MESLLERFIVSRKRRTALSFCVCAIPKGKRYALFPGKPFHTFPGIAPAAILADYCSTVTVTASCSSACPSRIPDTGVASR
ncbi:MAG: hypothetical protein EOS55_07335 [Mesorhizobium sp.]|nr:MAG: hypothetical protein EOS55_07335 [Mesorhizobium sp.]